LALPLGFTPADFPPNGNPEILPQQRSDSTGRRGLRKSFSNFHEVGGQGRLLGHQQVQAQHFFWVREQQAKSPVL